MEILASQHTKETIGLCLIAKDEEKNIERCINSVRSIVDEIIVVDTGSSDRTVELAEKCGAVIYHYPWDQNFSNARNFAMSQAKSQWLLLLDADEEVDKTGVDTIVNFIRTTQRDGAYFRVRNYIGDYAPDDFTLHNALRLIRNTGKYRYAGAIHEQIICENMQDYAARFETLPVILNHFGYLDQSISEKNKRKRNMPILESQLEKTPDDFFTLYYLGNEYLALNELKKALDYYLMSYENAKKHHMVFAHLYLRMITCMEALGDFSRALEFVEEGLRIYPLCTDFEFVRAVAYYRTRRYSLAIKSLNSCIKMGVPPAPLEFLEGCGTYRAAYMMGDIYTAMEDYDAACTWYQNALQYKPNYYTALYEVGDSLNRLYPDKDKVCSKLFACFEDPTQTGNIITGVDILIKEGLYAQALSKLNEVTDPGTFLPEIQYFKAMAFFYLNDLKRAVLLFEEICSEEIPGKEDRPALKPVTALYLLTAGMIEKNQKLMDRALGMVEKYCVVDAQSACRMLYAVYENLAQDAPPFENGGEKELETILTVLEIVLKRADMELLEQLLGVFAFVNIKSALMRLAKIYWDHGYRDQAVKLVFYSVKELDYLDGFGSEVLFKQVIP